MSRPVSDAFKAAAFAQQTEQAAIVLLTIEHDDLEAPIRLCSNPTTRISDDPLRYQTASRGEDYDFLPFQIKLPDEQEGAPPRAQLVLDNIGREMIAVLRSTNTPALALIEVVLSGSLDTVEAAFPKFRIVNVSYDAKAIQIDLSLDALGSEPFGFMNFTPGRFPGLFNNSLS